MKLTDETAIKTLRKVRVYDLEMMISDYPQDEVEGRTDWEMVANEAGWLLDSFDSYETANHESLEEAKDILSKSRYGKVGYLKWNGRPYTDYEVQDAKDLVNMYNRLVRFVGRLKKMGLTVPNY